jgi:O-antigen/teichoic acid export membrane protein
MATQLITWIITLVVIRLLTPSDYGLLAMATVVIGFLAMLSDLGLGQALVQRADVSEEVLRRMVAAILLSHGLLAVGVALAAPLVALVFDEPAVTPIVRVLCLQFPIAAFGVVPDALLQRRMEFRARSMVDLTGTVIGASTTLALALMGKGVWALVAGSITVHLARAIGLNLCAPFLGRPQFSVRGLRVYLRFGGNLTLSHVLWFVLSQADLFIAGRWLGKEALGVYSTTMHLASLPNQRIAALINQLAFPAFSRIQDDRRRVAMNTLLGIRVLALCGFPICWGISSLAPELVQVALGPKWHEAIVPLQLVSLIVPLRLVATFLPNAIQGVGRSDVVLGNLALGICVMLGAFLIGVHWGVLGLSWAWVIGAPVALGIGMSRSLAVLGRPLADLRAALAPSASAAGLMYLAVVAGRLLLRIEGVALLVSLAGVGAATYGVSAWVLNRQGCREAIDLLRSLLARRPAAASA